MSLLRRATMISNISLKLQKFAARSGESILSSAVKDFDKLAARIEKASNALAKQIELEAADIAAEREKLAIREAQSADALAKLSAAQSRSRRIADRVTGLVA
jgi:hypothetical protein